MTLSHDVPRIRSAGARVDRALHRACQIRTHVIGDAQMEHGAIFPGR